MRTLKADKVSAAQPSLNKPNLSKTVGESAEKPQESQIKGYYLFLQHEGTKDRSFEEHGQKTIYFFTLYCLWQ